MTLHGQVDALVFAGGIGEKSDLLRKRVTDEVKCLGFEIDEEKNGSSGKGHTVWDVGREGAKHRTLVCHTDEQFEMARHCVVDGSLFD